MTISTEKQIEALLFFKNEPVDKKWLKTTLNKSDAEIEEGIRALKESLFDRGIVLVEKDSDVALRTAPECSSLIESLQKEELSKDLGKAGLETLSIVLYHGPVTRAEIDYIRGVNSTFILRSLLVRGLVEKIPNPDDSRSFLYRPTFDLLSFLGISTISELPEYQQVQDEIESFKSQREASDGKEGV